MNEHLPLENIAYTIIILIGGIIVTYLKTIKKDAKAIKRDTTQVNVAVNHIEPGKKPLTQRVDRIEETLHTIQYDMDIAKTASIETSDRSKTNASNLVKTNNMMESLMESHVENKKQLSQILDLMPKRKDDVVIPEG